MTTTQLFTPTRPAPGSGGASRPASGAGSVATCPAEITVCPVDRLIPGRGVAALLPDGRQVAVYRIDDDEVRALCNIDPVARAAVMSRGLVGDRAGEPAVISPIGTPSFAAFAVILSSTSVTLRA